MKRLVLIIALVSPVLQPQIASPPSKPEAVDPALAPILDSLKQIVLAVGPMDTTTPPRSGSGDIKTHYRVSSFVADAAGCRIRYHKELNITNPDGTTDDASESESLFLENMGLNTKTVRAFKAAAFLGRDNAYHVWGFQFAERASAEKAADLLTRAVQICQTTPVAINAAAGQPSLAVTLGYIADKLNELGSFEYNVSDSNGHFFRTDYYHYADVVTDLPKCQIRYTKVIGSKGVRGTRGEDIPLDYVISFRRVNRVIAAPRAESITHQYARLLPPNVTFRTDTAAKELSLMQDGADDISMVLPDEELTNRLAKAITHAAELCGGGDNDPFKTRISGAVEGGGITGQPQPFAPEQTAPAEDPAVLTVYDQFENSTTISLTLQNVSKSASKVVLTSFEHFPGHAPRDFPQSVSFHVDGLPSVVGSNILLLDGQRIELGQIDGNGSLSVPIWAAAGIASATGPVQARLAGQTVLTLEEEHKRAIHAFLAKSVPGGAYDRADLDTARLQRWSVSQTRDFINGMLQQYRYSGEDYEHVELEGQKIAVYSFSERADNTVGGRGDAWGWKADVDGLAAIAAGSTQDAVLVPCKDSGNCVGHYVRRDDGDGLRYFDSNPSLQLRMRASPVILERTKNAFTYLIQTMQPRQ